MSHDDLPNDQLLQFVFGELSDAEQAAFRKAVAEDAELAAAVERLASAAAAVRAENVGQVSDDFNDRLRQRMSEVSEAKDAEGLFADAACDRQGQHAESPARSPMPLARLLNTWRCIMRSPVSRVAAAVVFVLAVAGVAVLFHGGGAEPAFADFLQPIREAKTVKYKMTLEVMTLSPDQKLLPEEAQKNLKKGLTCEVMMLTSVSRSHMERTGMGQSRSIEIWDGRQGKTLCLYPEQKRAQILNHPNTDKDSTPKEKTSENKTLKGKTPNADPENPLAYYRSLCLDAWHEPNVKRESLGEKLIDGRRLVGYRFTCPAEVITLWGDPTTVLPVRVETIMAMTPDMKVIMTDFEFNVAMDESLFSIEPPPGYDVTVIHVPPYDRSPAEEKDLIETLRECGEAGGGAFPPSLNLEAILQAVNVKVPMEDGRKWPSAKHSEESMRVQWRLQRGLNFKLALPPEADAHYAGKGASLGAADRAIFWYRPKDGKKYRVIYADLSIRQSDAPPSVPVTRPEDDLLDLFRYYTKACNGSFPDALDLSSLLQNVYIKAYAKFTPDGLKEPDAKKTQEYLRAPQKFQPGLTFVVSLPPQADAHYAGKGVSLGAADRPIFWYRPKDAKTYRVIFADLSIRQAAVPPTPPVRQPEEELIELLRYYSKLCGGAFPSTLTLDALIQDVYVKAFMKFSPKGEIQTPSGKQGEEYLQTPLKFQPGLAFVSALRPEADVHYAGKGVSFGAADRPIFWYRPKGGKKYRVIYADLSVRDADAPANVPVAQPEDELIEALRYFCELSGGPFPDSLTREALAPVVEKKLHLPKGQNPKGDQVPKFMEIAMKFLPALRFADALLPQADAHYAGKGVSLGAPGKPIFWYRPKDSKKYRVLYADLSVRDTDAPPKAPNAQPVSSRSKKSTD
jgi:outer membrane lipoprotein-sorting protein